VVYHVLSPSFDVHSEIRQRVNLALFERFAEEGIEFGFPTQKLYLSGADADGLPGVGERVVRKAPGPH